MGKPSLGDIAASIPDPMLSDNYVLDIPNIPTGASSIPFRMQCQQASKPGMTVNAVEVQLFGHTLEHVGNLTYSHEMSVQYLENRMGQIQKGLEDWAEFCRSHDTQTGAYKSEYARDGYLSIFDQRGIKVIEYVIAGMWPTQVPEVQFDGSNSQIVTLSASFKYDYYRRR